MIVYKQNRPNPMWVPLPINPEISSEKRAEVIKELTARLSRPELLLKVSQDVGLAKKWHLASDEEAARILGARLFVQVGEADGPLGKVPSINIGVTGKKKEIGVSGEIAMRLMDDVWKILDLKPPSKKGR